MMQNKRVAAWMTAGAGLLGSAALVALAAPTAAAAEPYVSVPSNYRDYGSPKTLHDYCSWSPDSFTTYRYEGPRAIAMTVSWKGPCARHDMCYEAHSPSYKATCDNGFLADLRTNCRWRFAAGSVYEARCYDEAQTYYNVVKRLGDG